MLAEGMNKTKHTRSVINLHTLSLPLPPSRCEVGPGCSSEDGVRRVGDDSPWQQATPPSSIKFISGDMNAVPALVSTVYKIQGSPELEGLSLR